MFQKAVDKCKNACMRLTVRHGSVRQTHQHRDELAEPLLRNEHPRGSHLHDIQEVDLEAGQGQGPSPQGSLHQLSSSSQGQGPSQQDSSQQPLLSNQGQGDSMQPSVGPNGNAVADRSAQNSVMNMSQLYLLCIRMYTATHDSQANV